ncbi:MAG: YciI family protein [Verrucomicrobia subdivision 3 bacterium]|nr:YciI family protein [Limisphaerales bacterium]
MNTQNTKDQYLLLFRGTRWDKELSPEEIQSVVNKWAAWFERLTKEGKAKAGQPLKDEGKVVSGKKRTVADGPFAESKEAIGGYFLLEVDSIDEAVAIAKECPGLDYGLNVEVRPVADQCMVRQRAMDREAGQELAAV